MQILDEDLFQQPVIFLDADVDISLRRASPTKYQFRIDMMNTTHVTELFVAWGVAPLGVCDPGHARSLSPGQRRCDARQA